MKKMFYHTRGKEEFLIVNFLIITCILLVNMLRSPSEYKNIGG